MLKHALLIDPRDLLFFRDARPMEAGDSGCGARWPLPSVLHEALLAALQAALPANLERPHHTRNRKDRNWDTSTKRLGGLRTLGPWPFLTAGRPGRSPGTGLPQGLYLPAPADLVPLDRESTRESSADAVIGCAPAEPVGQSDLPPFLKPVARTVPPGKEDCGEWLALAEFARYLAGSPCRTTRAAGLYGVERRTGIAIDPATRTTGQGRLYMPEYLRLADDVRLAAWAACPVIDPDGKPGDALAAWLPKPGARADLVLGGQRGVAFATSPGEHLPGLASLQEALCPPADGTPRIKWALLSPAVFSGGWRPGWVDASCGAVKLRPVSPQLRRGRRQDAKQARFDLAQDHAPPIRARLVAALVPKPLAFSGWDLIAGAPKPTRLAVPPGAVYYFECDDADSARALVASLHGRVKSDLFGEKGFGFGVCGTWAPLTDKATTLNGKE